MKKTALQVIDDLYQIVQASPLATTVTGKVYKEGQRPLNALTEDVVVGFVEGTAAQIQTGIVEVRIFIADIDDGAGGLIVNRNRCLEIEALAAEWSENIEDPDGYQLTPDRMVSTMPEKDTKQHVTTIRLQFIHTTF